MVDAAGVQALFSVLIGDNTEFITSQKLSLKSIKLNYKP